MCTFVRKHFPSFPSLTPNDWIDDELGGDPDQRGGVSRLYESIQMIASPSLNNIMAALEEERDLNFRVTPGKVQLKEYTQVQSVSDMVCFSSKFSFGPPYRLHLSKSRFARIYPNVLPMLPGSGHPYGLGMPKVGTVQFLIHFLIFATRRWALLLKSVGVVPVEVAVSGCHCLLIPTSQAPYSV